MPLLFIWLGINFAALVYFIHILKTTCEYWDALLYPKIDRCLDKEDVGNTGKLFVKILFTIMLFPAVVLYFLLILLIAILLFVCVMISKLFKKIFRK
jgi:hypothetical protein